MSPLRTLPAAALALLATFGATLAAAQTDPAAPAASAPATQVDGMAALDGEWIFVEDRTEGRPVEQQQPSMSTKVTLRVEQDALVLLRSDGEVRMALDGSATDIPREGRVSRYRGAWKDGAFEYEIEMVRLSDNTRTGRIRTELRPTAEGLLARVVVDPPTPMESVALYRQAQDIVLPAPATASIDDLAWIAGAWVGTRGTGGATSIEERWSPPLGGAMLGVSRTVSRGALRAFEFLRIVQRGDGLVYVAQPGGREPTEFVLTELSATRAVFENPRHDSPQRITYELSAEGALSASIGFISGGRPQRFDFAREDG